MSSDCYDACVVTISSWDAFKMHFFSFFLGTWVMVKKLLSSLWKASDQSLKKSRNTPPTCYVDTAGFHSYIKLKRVKLHYVECGAQGKPLLLLLHGFPDCWFGWRYQMPVLSDHFRVIALDLKGFGDSDKPSWRRSYRIEVLLQELSAVIHALGYSTCVLVGHDLGALLGWYFVHQFPELVEKFVSISCPHPNIYWNELPKTNIFNERWINFCQMPYLAEIEVLKDDLKILNKCYQHLEKKKDVSLIDAYKYVFARPEDWCGPINYYRNLPFTRINDCSGPTEVPCLLITGNKDTFAQLESVVKSTEYSLKYTVKIVDGAGHYPHQEMPETINAHLLSFLTVPKPTPKIEKPLPRAGLVNRMIGAVSSTVRVPVFHS
ncbi:hypothetical protein R5R35_012718 [Gryllus longicercus]|uniref:AB hydrolase-1 domain-containing protein n=1 Tax=Gryllus longicercus TaxID=2509291 RepID=A0AAN9VXS8_9ORTH